MADLRNIARNLPDDPGVYRFYDREGILMYVGKAKSLKKRVASYLGKSLMGKTRVMMAKVSEIRHTVVESESEALLLENNLIKRHQPRYNVLMKDDKTYPWICVKEEHFSRVFMTRNVVRDGSVYYGPYTSVVMVRTLLDLIKKLYPLRTCSYNLSEEKISSGKYRVCLEYHLGNCLGPCVGKQPEADYDESIRQVKEILKGNIHSVTRYLKNLMKKYAENLKYEEAQVIKEKLEILEKYSSRSTVVNPRIRDVDVFGMDEEDDKIFVNYLKIIRGALVQTHTVELRKRIEENNSEIMSLAIIELRERHSSNAPEIIMGLMPDIGIENIKYTVPRKGDRKKLLELSERNARVYKLNQRKINIKTADDRSRKNLEKLKTDLHLPDVPMHIECFDNSNIQGSNPVAACVVFRNARPSKKEYRHYNIKTVKGPDDYASMEEVVFRRYRRMLDEDSSLPDLVIIDGGKGQLNAAVKSLESLGIRGKVPVIGIAKRLEEIYFPGDSVPLYIDKNSISLKIIQHLRNEAHRFGISFHRAKRSGDMTKSSLDDIKGIGPKTKDLLIKKFGSLEKIKSVPAGDLENLIGKSKTEKIIDFLQNSS
ncbi:MAG: excinuclease ABC subunit UvrC [Bacteroidales bacterium]|nr:excinuclease ABC subunit UvrC [Bacteroidales bacterium]